MSISNERIHYDLQGSIYERMVSAGAFKSLLIQIQLFKRRILHNARRQARRRWTKTW
jgi:hypothetical protein